MAILDLTLENLAYHQENVQALRADTDRLWGEMSVEPMMWHLRRTIELSLDDPDNEMTLIAPPIIRDVAGWIFFDLFTIWKKGKLKSLPMFISDDVGSFSEEQGKLLNAMQDFVLYCAAHLKEKHIHPLLGHVPLRRWAHAYGVHNNHHYRQFGLVSP